MGSLKKHLPGGKMCGGLKYGTLVNPLVEHEKFRELIDTYCDMFTHGKYGEFPDKDKWEFNRQKAIRLFGQIIEDNEPEPDDETIKACKEKAENQIKEMLSELLRERKE